MSFQYRLGNPQCYTNVHILYLINNPFHISPAHISIIHFTFPQPYFPYHNYILLEEYIRRLSSYQNKGLFSEFLNSCGRSEFMTGSGVFDSLINHFYKMLQLCAKRPFFNHFFKLKYLFLNTIFPFIPAVFIFSAATTRHSPISLDKDTEPLYDILDAHATQLAII